MTGDGHSHRILAYNVRYDLNEPGKRAWKDRRDAVAETVHTQSPDIVAFQEVWKTQLADLRERLPEFEWVVPTDGDEHAAIAYRSDRYDVVDSGSRWLSEPETPPGVAGWDSTFPKRFTYAILEERGRDSTRLAVFSIHLPHTGQRAPRAALDLVLETVGNVTDELPTVITGDFNVEPGEDVYERATSEQSGRRELAYATTRASVREGPDVTFTGFPDEDEEELNIDHTLVTPDLSVERVVTVVPDRESTTFVPADHRPIYVDVTVR